MREGFRFAGAGGTVLRASVWGERGTGLLVLVHGYGEHAGRYGEFACWLVERGFVVAAFDLRGHGNSPGRRGHIARFSQYIEDLRCFLGALGERFPRARVALLGHSLGGLIVARFLEEHPGAAAGAVLSSPALALSLPVPRWKRALARVASVLLPGLSLPNGIPPEALSRDPAVVEAYRRDPLVHRVATARWFVETLRAQEEALEEAGRIVVPLLVVYGDGDRLVSPEAIRRFFSRVGSREKELAAYPGVLHEPLNEMGKEAVWERIHGWLEGVMGRP